MPGKTFDRHCEYMTPASVDSLTTLNINAGPEGLRNSWVVKAYVMPNGDLVLSAYAVEYDEDGKRHLVEKTAFAGPDRALNVTKYYVDTEEEARNICRAWNDSHDPGFLSRKAEYEKAEYERT